jgi:uridine kinase
MFPSATAARLNKPFLVGITGISGSGKTSFLKSFLKHFDDSQICLISLDDYYIPVPPGMTKEENKLYNFDLPSSIDVKLFLNDLADLLNQKKVYKQQYTFNNPDKVPQMLEISPAPIIIIEGLFILHFTAIAEQLNFKIFIEADNNVALKRRLDRDYIERGYPPTDVHYKWINHVEPAYRQYLLAHKEKCELVIYNNTNQVADLDCLSETVSIKLKTLFTAFNNDH